MPEAKPHLNILTLGYGNDGKTTLAAAITKILAKQGLAVAQSYNALAQTHATKEEGVVLNKTEVAFQTKKNAYTLVDCARHGDVLKYLTTSSKQVDGVVLVASIDSSMQRIWEQVSAAREAGVGYLVVFLNKADLVEDTEQLELLEMEIRDFLNLYGFDGDECPVFYGSALQALSGDAHAEAKIMELLEVCDQSFQPSTPNNDTRACSKFSCMFYLLNKAEGGRDKPIFKGYYPHFTFGTTVLKGGCEMPVNVEMILPGDNANMIVTLDTPVNMAYGQRFKICEGSNVVGIGRVTEILS